jgi:hypothetical protein
MEADRLLVALVRRPVDCRVDAVLRKQAFAFTIPSIPPENPPSAYE